MAVAGRLLKGPEAKDHTLYASHTVWESRTAFEAWTRSKGLSGRSPWGRTEQAPLPRPSPIRGLRGSPDHRRSREGDRRGLRADPRSIPSADRGSGNGCTSATHSPRPLRGSWSSASSSALRQYWSSGFLSRRGRLLDCLLIFLKEHLQFVALLRVLFAQPDQREGHLVYPPKRVIFVTRPYSRT